MHMLKDSDKAKPEAALAQAFDYFAKKNAIRYRNDAQNFYVESNGIPDHPLMIGIRSWQQQVPLPQAYNGENAWQIPLHPKPAAQPASAKNRFLRGAIALAVNGIPIFNPLNNRGDDAYEFGELDEFGGHCGRADDYHYHIAPVHLEKQLGKGAVLAYALDGYPIYGYEEPDGSPVTGLDALNGHHDRDGNYHYHATKKYPYLNGGFHGEVVERDGQVDPQPRAQGVREALPPMQGAKITDYRKLQDNRFLLTYQIGTKYGYVEYSLQQTGVDFTFTDISGRATKESYPYRREGRRPPPERREGPPPGGRSNRGQQPPAPPARGQGNERRPENPPPRPNESAAAEKSKPMFTDQKLAVACPAFDAEQEMLPKEFTCDGAGISPPVRWGDAPKGTRAFVVSLWHQAPDQEKSYWVVYNIPADAKELQKDNRNVGTIGLNDKRKNGYDPMCSKGPGVKVYHLSVYALDAPVSLAAGQADRSQLLKAMKGHVLAEGTMDYRYERAQ